MAQINPQFAQIGEQFVNHYYQTFDSNRQNLSGLYTTESLLSFEGDMFEGTTKIIEKLASLPFQKVQHKIVKSDYQPNPFNNGVIVFVTGDLKIDDNENALKFAQVFHLVPLGGSFVIVNDLFRLNVG